MQEEYNSLMVNSTWTLVPLPIGRKLVSCEWVFKIKQGANGEVECYKAKLMARGEIAWYQSNHKHIEHTSM
jgi:hypothetical protein